MEKAKLTNFIHLSTVSFANCDVCVHCCNVLYINKMCHFSIMNCIQSYFKMGLRISCEFSITKEPPKFLPSAQIALMSSGPYASLQLNVSSWVLHVTGLIVHSLSLPNFLLFLYHLHNWHCQIPPMVLTFKEFLSGFHWYC